MKRIATILLFGFIISGVGGIVITQARSQTLEVQPAVLRAGDYRDLTWYRSVKLGTAPFVNPGLIRQAAVAYKYNIKAFTEAQKTNSIIKMLASGHLGLMYHEAGAYKVYPIDEALEIWGKAGMTDGVILSLSKELFNVPSMGLVVSWDATIPLDAPAFAHKDMDIK